MTKGVISLQRVLKNKLAEFSKEEFSDYLMPHIIFNSCKEAMIEGCKGIIEYKPNVVRVNCGKYILRFKGDNLSVKAPTTDEITVMGEIVSFEFCSC
jgi:sporulation protein YqfC